MAVFYCQLDYEHVAYPNPVNGRGTIADNGCGPCSASMVAENMLGVKFPPEEAAAFGVECGGRVQFGTNFYIYAEAFAKKFGLRVRDTEDADEAKQFLAEKKGMVIANTFGDRPDDGYIGVFSNSGHYIVLAGLEGDEVKVWDPMYRPGRFDIPGRAGKVRMDGTDAYADFSIIRSDCVNRPFFLFEKP